jgi:hypothetical protein
MYNANNLLWNATQSIVKVKVTTGHAYAGTEGRQRCGSNPLETSAIEGADEHHATAALLPGKPGNHCAEGYKELFLA